MPRIAALCKSGVVTQHASNALLRSDIHTAEDLLWLTSNGVHGVAEKTKLSEEELLRVVAAVLRHVAPTPRRGSDIFCEWQQRNAIISTGSSALDTLLNGGIFTSELCELAGGSGSGKTQFCYSLALSAASANAFTVQYIDSGASFSAPRLQEMLQHSRGDGESAAANAREDAVVLTRIRTVQVRDATTLLHTMSELEEKLAEASTPRNHCFAILRLSDLEEKLAEASTPRNPASFFRNLKLVVIDSLGSLFACVIGGRQSVGHALLVSVSTLIQRIMTQYHIAFVVTNHTTEYQGKVSPALGDTWTHMPCVSMVLTRPDLKASDSSARRATIRKSNKNDTLAAADFSVGVVGVADPVCEVSTSEESR